MDIFRQGMYTIVAIVGVFLLLIVYDVFFPDIAETSRITNMQLEKPGG